MNKTSAICCLSKGHSCYLQLICWTHFAAVSYIYIESASRRAPSFTPSILCVDGRMLVNGHKQINLQNSTEKPPLANMYLCSTYTRSYRASPMQNPNRHVPVEARLQSGHHPHTHHVANHSSLSVHATTQLPAISSPRFQLGFFAVGNICNTKSRHIVPGGYVYLCAINHHHTRSFFARIAVSMSTSPASHMWGAPTSPASFVGMSNMNVLSPLNVKRLLMQSSEDRKCLTNCLGISAQSCALILVSHSSSEW